MWAWAEKWGSMTRCCLMRYFQCWHLFSLIYLLVILLFPLLSFMPTQCPDPSCKQDLLAYLEQIKFYSHQLKICSQVKAEIQNLGGELIMSAVSCALHLYHHTQKILETKQQHPSSPHQIFQVHVGFNKLNWSVLNCMKLNQ